MTILAPGSSTASGSLPGAVKWHPGHYVTLTPFASDGTSYFDNVLEEISHYPNLLGVQKRYMWAELETSEGQYDFSEIQRDLDQLASRHKRLVILLQTKSYKAESPVAPAYLSAAKYEGGVFGIKISGGNSIGSKNRAGTNIKLWNPLVRDRLAALVRALGARFNSHPYLEAVSITETALGQPTTVISNYQQEQYFDSLLAVDREMRVAFPNTVTIQFVNFPRWTLNNLIGGLANAGVGLGGPDIFLADHSLSLGVYTYYPRLAGIVPLAPSVQHEDYYARSFRGPRDAPSVEELYRFAVDELQANYLFWTRRMAPPERPYAKVLEMLRSPTFPKDSAGGLHTACPKAYPSCDGS